MSRERSTDLVVSSVELRALGRKVQGSAEGLGAWGLSVGSEYVI